MTDEQSRVEQALAAWRRIEAWLKEHEPGIHRSLPAPMPEEEIQAVERDLDLVIPPDLRAFYRLHNGTGPAASFDWPTRDIPMSARKERWGDYFLPGRRGIGLLGKMSYWSAFEREVNPNRRYLPFIVTDPDGLYGLFADCAPGDGYGMVGTFGEGYDHTPGVWPSFAAYLAQVADGL